MITSSNKMKKVAIVVGRQSLWGRNWVYL